MAYELLHSKARAKIQISLAYVFFTCTYFDHKYKLINSTSIDQYEQKNIYFLSCLGTLASLSPAAVEEELIIVTQKPDPHMLANLTMTDKNKPSKSLSVSVRLLPV